MQETDVYCILKPRPGTERARKRGRPNMSRINERRAEILAKARARKAEIAHTATPADMTSMTT